MIEFLNLIPEPSEAVIICYPRCASTYLGRYIEQRTMKHLQKIHHLKVIPGYKIVGIIRNPVDALASFVSMVGHHENRVDYDKILEKQIIKYNLSLEFLIKNADIIVDHKTIIENPEYSVKTICDFLNIKIKYNFDYVDQIEDIPKDHFLKTSKRLESYSRILEIIDKTDIAKSENLYKIALQLDKTI